MVLLNNNQFRDIELIIFLYNEKDVVVWGILVSFNYLYWVRGGE